eukprot:scaffold2848_cov352-Pavlova_lutheri.AAC.12
MQPEGSLAQDQGGQFSGTVRAVCAVVRELIPCLFLPLLIRLQTLRPLQLPGRPETGLPTSGSRRCCTGTLGRQRGG